MAAIHLYCGKCDDWHPIGECPEEVPLADNQYRDPTGAVHTLWIDAEGNGNARIDVTVNQ